MLSGLLMLCALNLQTQKEAQARLQDAKVA